LHEGKNLDGLIRKKVDVMMIEKKDAWTEEAFPLEEMGEDSLQPISRTPEAVIGKRTSFPWIKLEGITGIVRIARICHETHHLTGGMKVVIVRVEVDLAEEDTSAEVKVVVEEGVGVASEECRLLGVDSEVHWVSLSW
jgi:hypothetical protein